MKKKVLAIALVTVFTGTGVAQAADVTAQQQPKKTPPVSWL